DHQRTGPAMQRLAPERVEVIRRRAWIEDPDVALRGKLQEPFKPRARMFRAAALIGVGKKKGEPRRLTPFGKSRDDELVDDDLRAIREIAELRLPADQCIRCIGTVAVLEPERRILRQWAVVQLEGGAGAHQVLNRRPSFSGSGIVKDQVALAERAALRVLTSQPDREAAGDQ